MSQENVEIARRLYVATTSLLEKAAAGGDISDTSEYWDLFDPDVVVVEIAEIPDAATYRGFEQMRRWIQGWLDAFEKISIEPQEFVPVGDHVVVSTHQRFRSKVGIEVEQDVTQVLQFRDGRVIHATGYRDKANALNAAGLSRDRPE
jgi:ketosteroid isomerase-like protein